MIYKKINNAFSLVELMISLITVSLISAAFAPVITKKLSKSTVTVKSAVAAIRSDCAKFEDNGGKCSACIDDACLLCDINCSENQYKNIGKCLCENCSLRSEGCLFCSSTGCDKCQTGYYLDEAQKCVKCPKGSKCPDGKTRELCPIGYYQDEEKKSVCKGCLTSNGNYTNKEGSTACLSCVAGQYTVDKNWDWHWDGKEHYGTACATCPAGHYCPDGKSAFACGNNNYQDETGKTTCKACPNGTFSPNSPSSSCSACDEKCTACYQSATNCSSCNSGYYLSSSSCNSCPANASCSGGTGGFSCNSGYKISGSTCELDKCPNGQYKCGTSCCGCPSNASCNGYTFSCNSGYTWNGYQCNQDCHWQNVKIGNAVNGKCRSGWYTASGWAGPGCYQSNWVCN